MTSERDPGALVAEVLTATDVDRDHVPRLLDLLDVGDRQVRLGAATALCVVADAHPGTAASLVGRLADRADDSLAAALALDYLAERYPTVVEERLDRWETTGEPTRGVERSTPTRGGSDDRAVGRTRIAGRGTDDDGRQVYSGDEDDESQPRAGGDEDEGNTMGQRPRAADAEWRSLVEYESQFDRLSVLAPRERRRYGDTYRTLGVADETEYAVALRLLDGPDGTDASFERALAARLEEWSTVADVENVLTLYDWSEEPRPWLATEYTAETLADRDRFSTVEAAWHAERLAGAVATLHERGVVHAGVDAESVAYYGNVIEESDRQPPLLDAPGLLSVYRHRFDPARFLDPRYAAPEYYQRRFGRVDHATDIYGLGAVCYRLFTGEPPYSGAFDSVRDGVLSAGPPEPSAVADVPPAVDDIVGKAMARRKLGRYETAAHLRQELQGLRGEDA
ncbi:protein kinase domain-containing protein [Haloarcula onubensis]|uniref:Serine/threonine protein kinase n=1 Tax=Haloarcula onubensis TaxID=2950539 RepID=A0ABU2FMR6_9EURY|nr:serine/threonine protein kinase [Halomicroarcula sp. S3CR25-11]MDS0281481.1 serine/threonine protein kinase [Halomicroarcula sp. S3CR25-11]